MANAVTTVATAAVTVAETAVAIRQTGGQRGKEAKA